MRGYVVMENRTEARTTTSARRTEECFGCTNRVDAVFDPMVVKLAQLTTFAISNDNFTNEAQLLGPWQRLRIITLLK